jgi:hypothetical protein
MKHIYYLGGFLLIISVFMGGISGETYKSNQNNQHSFISNTENGDQGFKFKYIL